MEPMKIMPKYNEKYWKQKTTLMKKSLYEHNNNYGPFPSQFCDRLRILRERAVLTKTDVANALDMTLQRYHRYEKGTAEPSLSILPKLARILGTDVNTLVGDFNSDVFLNEHIAPEPLTMECFRTDQEGKECIHLCFENTDSAIFSFDIPAEDFDTLITYAKNYAISQTEKQFDNYFTRDIVARTINYIMRHNEELVFYTDGEASTEENIKDFLNLLLDARTKIQTEFDKEFRETFGHLKGGNKDEKKK